MQHYASHTDDTTESAPKELDLQFLQGLGCVFSMRLVVLHAGARHMPGAGMLVTLAIYHTGSKAEVQGLVRDAGPAAKVGRKRKHAWGGQKGGAATAAAGTQGHEELLSHCSRRALMDAAEALPEESLQVTLQAGVHNRWLRMVPVALPCALHSSRSCSLSAPVLWSLHTMQFGPAGGGNCSKPEHRACEPPGNPLRSGLLCLTLFHPLRRSFRNDVVCHRAHPIQFLPVQPSAACDERTAEAAAARTSWVGGTESSRGISASRPGSLMGFRRLDSPQGPRDSTFPALKVRWN